MKIGIVCYPTYGGSGVIATELGIALSSRGHEVHFITYRSPFRLELVMPNIYYHEVPIADYPLFEYLPYETALTSKMVSVALFENLDVFHVHYAIPHASAAFLAKQILKSKGKNVPVITTLHGTDITLVGKDASYEPVVTFAINQSDGVTAVSKSLKDETLQNFNIEKEIAVIPNFVDLKRFSKKKKDHFKTAIAPNGEKILVHASNFRKVKRIEDVVAVFARVIKEVPAKLLLAGDGPERGNIEKLCRELNVFEHVRFLGKLEAVEEVLSICDLFLLTSETESFGLAALEAMACSVPVISTNTGGSPEVNVHGVTGFMSNVGDVEDMAKNALTLLKDDSLLATFKNGALGQAKKFEISEILPVYENYYKQIVSASGKN